MVNLLTDELDPRIPTMPISERREVVLNLVSDQIKYDPASYLQSSIETEYAHSLCGTACCVFGWFQVIANRFGIVFGDNFDKAQEWLGLSAANTEDIDLFTASPEFEWPEPFRTQWYETLRLGDILTMRKAQGEIALALLAFILAHDGRIDLECPYCDWVETDTGATVEEHILNCKGAYDQ